MRLLKKYFNRENKFSLKERFNMVMTVVTCFFMGVMSENGRGMQGIKGLIDGIGGLAVRMNGWLSVVTGWELGAHEAYEIYEKGIVGRNYERVEFDTGERSESIAAICSTFPYCQRASGTLWWGGLVCCRAIR